MSDQFTEVTKTGYGGRIINSIKGVALGFLLFIASFFVLYVNEGRMDFSKLARTAQEVSADSVSTDPALKGKLISTNGNLSSEETLDDTFLTAGNYFAVRRSVEMFSWVEHKETRTHKELGGSETRETTYTYTKEWTAHAPDSHYEKLSGDLGFKSTDYSRFQHPEGHVNPPLAVPATILKVHAAKIGAYNIDMASTGGTESSWVNLDEGVGLPAFSSLPLDTTKVILAQGAQLANENYLFLGKGSFAAPLVGDLRISYGIVPLGIRATIFGTPEGALITPYFDGHNNKLFRIFSGSRGEAIATMHSEYSQSIWLLRGIGLALMWLGLWLILAPFGVLLDVVPALGFLGRGAIFLVTLPLALALSLITIVVSSIIHSLVALLIAMGVSIVGIIFLIKRARAKK